MQTLTPLEIEQVAGASAPSLADFVKALKASAAPSASAASTLQSQLAAAANPAQASEILAQQWAKSQMQKANEAALLDLAQKM